MASKKCGIIIWIFFLIFFLINIFTLVFTVWMTEALSIIYYILFSFLSINYLYFLLYELPFKIYFIKVLKEKIDKNHSIFIYAYLFLLVISYIILTVNFSIFAKYLGNCPFAIDDPDYKLHLKRRCELYNINNNSRYAYQYICSYNSSKDFQDKNKKENNQEITPNKVICIPVNKLIQDNDIITLFNNEYLKETKFYCSRTDKPKNNTYVKNKDCNKDKLTLGFTFFLLSLFKMYFIIIYIRYLNRKNQYERRWLFHRHFGRPFHQRRSMEALEIRQLINFGRLLNLIRDMININLNIVSSSNCSTEASENPNPNGNEELEERPKNIIVENKNEYSIEIDINNLSPDKKENDKNSINMDQINLDMNSEEYKIKNQNNNINNINDNI